MKTPKKLKRSKAKKKIDAAAEELKHLLPNLDPTFHSEVSFRSHIAHVLGPVTLKPVLGLTPLITPVLLGLQSLDGIAKIGPHYSRVVTRTTVDTPTWTAHLYSPKRITCSKVMVYFHGGAFISGGLGTHRRIVEKMAAENECAILSVAYRQYPSVLFDTTVEDCNEAVEWLMDQGYDAHDVVLVGDSAGGGLAFRVAGDLLARGKRVSGVIAMSGWLDFDSAAKKTHHWSRKDAYIPAARLEKVAKLILGREPQPQDSPIHSLTHNFPSLLLICGANEILRLDSEAAHRKAVELGVSCETHFFRGGVHAFPVATNLFPEGDRALKLMRAFVTRLMEEDEAA